MDVGEQKKAASPLYLKQCRMEESVPDTVIRKKLKGELQERRTLAFMGGH